MRTDNSHLSKFRNTKHPQYGSTDEDGMNGFFVIPMSKSIAGVERIALVISGEGNDDIPWEHVSLRISEGKGNGWKETLPNWDEMCAVKGLFWTDDETVVQFHPKRTEYVDTHPMVLHLWKPKKFEIELPPKIAV